jgi:hypothetical protein
MEGEYSMFKNLMFRENSLHLYLVAAALVIVALIGVFGCQPPPPVTDVFITPPEFVCDFNETTEENICTAIYGQDEKKEPLRIKVIIPSQTVTSQEERIRAKAVSVPYSINDRNRVIEQTVGVFKAVRLITNFRIETVKGEVLETFNPKIELRVDYSGQQWSAARDAGAQRLHMAYWNLEAEEENQGWVLFSEKDGFELEGDETGGTITLSIADWGDPLIGSGP